MKSNNKIAKNKDSLFCFCVVIIFILQWLMFWVYANLNSIRLAFTQYNILTDKHELLPFGELFLNFKNFLHDITSNLGLKYVLNGVLIHSLSVFLCLPISYMIAFVINKKLVLTGFFKVILYLPSILSTLVMVLLYKHFIEGYIDGIWLKVFEKPLPYVFKDPKYNWYTVLFYIIFFSIPGSLLINLGSMARVPNELIEYGEIEGISLFKEFIVITVPMIYPVLEVQCLGLFIGFFTTQGPLYILYGGEAPDNLQTFAYYMFTSVFGGRGGVRVEKMYAYNSAANLIIGLASIPIVQFTKWLLDKFDPGAEY